MKLKRLSLAVVAVLAAGSGWWLSRSDSRTPASNKLNAVVVHEMDDRRPQDSGPHGQPKPGQRHQPPDPTRLFRDFTPEQRVEFARKGHGPGG